MPPTNLLAVGPPESENRHRQSLGFKISQQKLFCGQFGNSIEWLSRIFDQTRVFFSDRRLGGFAIDDGGAGVKEVRDFSAAAASSKRICPLRSLARSSVGSSEKDQARWTITSIPSAAPLTADGLLSLLLSVLNFYGLTIGAGQPFYLKPLRNVPFLKEIG